MTENLINLRIGGVPEHFNLPWRMAIEEEKFLNENINLQWSDFGGGTGAMANALRNNELDLAIMLTEGITADIITGNAVGNKAKIIKVYVKSPLTWGIYRLNNKTPTTPNPSLKVGGEKTPHLSKEGLGVVTSFDQLKKNIPSLRYAISRFGSGSHLMACVDACRRNWDIKTLNFVELKNLAGMCEGLKNDLADVFMWESVMTQPHVDSGLLEKLDETITPWSCFMLVASENILKNNPLEIQKICHIINDYVKDFKTKPSILEKLVTRYQIDLEKTAHWLHNTHWATDNEIPTEMLENVMEELFKAKIISEKVNPNQLFEIIR